MKQSNVRSIGAFVIGAIVLIVAAIAYFGSQDLFKEERRFVAYFNSSVNGLNVGSPVKFRGIEIGQVETIEGVYDPKKVSLIPRITLVIYPETMQNAELQDGQYNLFKPLVESGMRGSLKSQSLLTGQLYISLDFHPDNKIRKLGSANEPYPEMPTVESGLGEFLTSIQKLPIDQIVGQLSNTLGSLETLLTNEDLQATLAELPELTRTLKGSARTITGSANSFGRFADKDLPQTTAELRKLFANSGNSVTAISNKLNSDTLVRLDNTLAKVDETLALAQTRLDRDDPVTIELVNALREISGAAASLNRLTDLLEEQPESIIRGKSDKGAEE